MSTGRSNQKTIFVNKLTSILTPVNMSELEAYSLLEKAEKKAKSNSWFSGNKFEEASELYTKAANMLKVARKCILV